MNIQKNTVKRVRFLALAVVSLCFSVISLLTALDLCLTYRSMDPIIAFGLSIIFMMWCYYGYDNYAMLQVEQENDCIPVTKDYPIEFFLTIAPRILLLSMALFWFLKLVWLGFITGCATSIVLGIEAVINFKIRKRKLIILFACAYFIWGVSALLLGAIPLLVV